MQFFAGSPSEAPTAIRQRTDDEVDAYIKSENAKADIHSCSYYCDRPGCIKAQRDELRDEITDLRNELAEYTQAADKLAAENKVLRDELARLREPLYAAPPAQPAQEPDHD